MRILHISDSHTYHRDIIIPPNIDMIIFSGDCSNPREPYLNEHEVRDFITWYNSLDIKHKIFVGGNHDTSLESGHITKDNFGFGIHYLENESIEIEGLKIWGSPVTPTFGIGWAFNKARHKIGEVWATIPDDTDIVVVHGPPKGILDLSYNRNNELEFCGCESLRKRIKQIKPKLVCFGHIHDCEGVRNFGIRKIDDETIYSNGSCVTDGNFGKYINQGNIIEL